MAMILSGKKDVYLEILEKYRGYIQAGLYAPGERLPSVRTIASDIGVNPNTVAKAFSLLEEQGYIRSLPKKGMYVAYPPAPASQQPEQAETAGPDAAEASSLLLQRTLVSLKSAGFDYQEILIQLKEVYGIHD